MCMALLMVFPKDALMCTKKVKLINHDCLSILMLLYIMLYIVLAYLMLYIIIIMVIFKCYYSRELIALSYKKQNNNNGVNIELGKTNRLKALCMQQTALSKQALYTAASTTYSYTVLAYLMLLSSSSSSSSKLY